jgi:hypothetical protein
MALTPLVRRSQRQTQASVFAIALVAGCLFSLVEAAPAAAQGFRAFVLSNNSLISLDTANPAAAAAPLPITGLSVGDTVVGIDFRPQNGMLYGLGYNSGVGTVQLYSISWRTGFATVVGASGTFVAADGTTPVPIAGTAFGFDFNPTVDRIRVVNNAGQNFRMNPNTGTFVDGDLGGAAGSNPGINMDGPINGGATEVSGAAYTNNQPNATTTTLYTMRAASNTLYIQNPPNAGTETTPLQVTLNSVPLAFTAANGFDIPPGVNVAISNTPAVGSGLAALTAGGISSIYSINLSTGAATLVGPIGNGAIAVQDLAIQGEAVAGGTPAITLSAGSLVRFNTATPGTTTTVATTGIILGETLVGIDWRPQTGQLFGLGFNGGSGTGSATLYRLDPQNGAATIIGLANGVADGVTGINLTGATAFGFDFNPTVDRIRVVTNAGQNFRINPTTGAAILPGDTAITGGATGATGAAYTNSFGQNLVGGVTTLYTLDAVTDKLFIQNPPNNGIETIGLSVTVSGTPLDFTSAGGFDIPPAVKAVTSNAAASGQAYAVLTASGITSLYRLDLLTGAATSLGVVSAGTNGLAVADGPIVPTVVTLTPSANPSLITQSVTFTATVTASISTGTVDFTANGSPITGCTGRPVAAGTATCTNAFALTGDYAIVATYSGDQGHAPSGSAPLTQHVQAGTTATTTTVSAGPNPAQVGETVILIGSVTTPTVSEGVSGTMFFSVDGVGVGTSNAVNGTASFATTTIPAGTHSVTARFDGNTTLAGSMSQPVALVVKPVSATFTQYFAEGATGNFFQTDVGVFNASKTDTAHIRLTAFPETGAPIPMDFTLSPLGRRTVDLNVSLGGQTGVSTLVESDQPVAATRQMTWGSPVYGSTLESGATAPATTWYFAEGATNLFSLFYLIENPNSGAATVTLTHLLEGGAAPVVQSVTVPGFTRQTYYINDVPGLRFAALSTTITSDLPIVAERAMYLNTSGRLWEGGHAGHGATALSQHWFFAEGATGFFHTYLLLGNPHPGTTTVNVSYQFPDGTAVSKAYDVPGRSRRTVDVNFEDPALASATVAISVTAGSPIIAERAIYWGAPFTDGTASLGSRETGTAWAIGEGIEGGTNAQATFVLVANLSTTNPATARFTVAYDDGTQDTKDYQVPANARLTVRVNVDFPKSENKRFSVLVESVTLEPITVDLARYTRDLDAGGAALATKIR